ncbi:hypothetical protein MMC34_001163 [Xylographa carneopallida]|nr:hypothetical protein [Xylographa carneopallida]
MPLSIDTTPCPIHEPSARSLARPAGWEETVGKIDFSFDLQAAFREAAPRRRRDLRKGYGALQIFEDGAEVGELCAGTGGEALRLDLKTNAGASTRTDIPAVQRRDTTAAAPARSRLVAPPRNEKGWCDGRQNQPGEQGRKSQLRKEPRRRTIYVPSEDTTILTIHPGVHDTRHGATESITQDLARSLARAERTKVRQSLAVAPRRAPLQAALKKLQENNVVGFDVPGRPTGKENVPPGGVFLMRKAGKTKSTNGDDVACSRRSSSLRSGKYLAAQTARSGPAPRTSADRLDGHLSKQSGKRCAGRANLSPVNDCCPKKVAETLIKPVVKPSRKLAVAYALLNEDISHPEMFEENWLSNQETAITELINSLFRTKCTAPSNTLFKDDSLRHRLMQLYQQPSMLLLYRRLEASLNYGALRPSAESMMECCRLTSDVGIRRRFNELWMKTYNLEHLRYAAEVVVGREASFLPSSQSSRCRADARNLEAFIETCLLRNDDSAPPMHVPSNAPSWSWRRTVQRCLMLILLLDTAKNRKIIRSNLFQTTSAHKSSSAVLNELTCLLVPNGGNLRRALAHLDYHLTHEQHPLSEYNYMIENLAVDLRDGIQLAHLVEILVYPAPRLAEQHEDTTIVMLSGEASASLTSTGNFGILSQHLKYPCETKACRLYNVEIVLSALDGLQGMTSIIQNVRPEDIVDGHREKTILLLWGLVGRWGLEALVDKTEVESEIHRLETRHPSGRDVDAEDDITELEGDNDHGRLLQTWATAVARKRGLKVWNLSTCFADGKVFRCIVDEYQPFITRRGGVGADMTLATKLKDIGCSRSFASMFGCIAPGGQVFGKDFTLAALAFLCSRLLGASTKRRVLAGLAAECAKVVITRTTVIRAAVVLQRSWRAHVVWTTRRGREQEESVDFWLV